MEPLIVTCVPTGPTVGFTLVMLAGGGSTVIIALPDFVGSATEVAVTVTVRGLGTTDGAIYPVFCPDAVYRVPQAAPEQPAPEIDHVTPLFCKSF